MFLTEKPQAVMTVFAQTPYVYFNSTVLNRFPFTEGSFQPHHKPLNLPPRPLRENKLHGWERSSRASLSSAGPSRHPATFTFITSKRELADNNEHSFTTTAQGVFQTLSRGRCLNSILLRELIKHPGQHETSLTCPMLSGHGQRWHLREPQGGPHGWSSPSTSSEGGTPNPACAGDTAVIVSL